MRSAVGLVLLASLLVGCRAPGGGIRVALVGSFETAEGAAAQRAARMAVTEINAGGGIRGRPLLLVERDDRNNLDSAVAVAADLAGGNVIAVVGHTASALTAAVTAVYRTGREPMALLVPVTTPPDLTRADHVFRMVPSDSAQGATLAGWARGAPDFARAAILYQNDTYGRGVRQAFEARFTALGGEVVSLGPWIEPAVDPYLDRIAARGDVDVLVLAGTGPEVSQVLERVRTRGLTIPVLGPDGLVGVERLGPMAQGVHLAMAYHPGAPLPANQAFVLGYTEGSPDVDPPSQVAASVYDAFHLLRTVISDGGASRRGVLGALGRIGTVQPPFQGVTGIVSFTAQGDLARFPLLIGAVEDGAIRLVERR